MDERQCARQRVGRFKHARLVLATAGVLAGCTTTPYYEPAPARPAPGSVNANGNSRTAHHEEGVPAPLTTSNMSLDRYKRVIAERIAALSPTMIYPGNPQALLRSVVVIKYVLDANGRLLSSAPLRTNGDAETTATALGALRRAAPFPAPPSRLLSRGRLEILETMLFNDDGRFQIRSIAERQLSE